MGLNLSNEQIAHEQHHMVLSLMAGWFLSGETHQGQALTSALTLPHVRDGLSLLPEVYCTPSVDDICPVSVCHRASYVYRYSRYIPREKRTNVAL